jgi:hypothetical protein
VAGRRDQGRQSPRCGTLPDFGNFRIGKKPGGSDELYDRYQGVQEMMPSRRPSVPKATTSIRKAMKQPSTTAACCASCSMPAITRDWAIEYEGQRLSEPDGIRAIQGAARKHPR